MLLAARARSGCRVAVIRSRYAHLIGRSVRPAGAGTTLRIPTCPPVSRLLSSDGEPGGRQPRCGEILTYLPISNYFATARLPPNPPHTHHTILILPPTYLQPANGFNLLEHNCVTFGKSSWMFRLDPYQPTTPCGLHHHYYM